MRPVTFSADSLAELLLRRTVASMAELVAALGFPSERTVFRKLRQLSYLSSYSHRGRYYALRECARFDDAGLWSHDGIRFSTHGTLLATAEALADSAVAGFRPEELDARLGVSCLAALRKLVRDGRLASVRVADRALYCSADSNRRRRQQTARAALEAPLSAPPAAPAVAAERAGFAAATALFAGLLDEQQRRLFAGLASLLCGRDGDKRAAAWLGLHPRTVRRGRRELVSGDVRTDRVRKPGGGRKSLGEKSLR